MNTNSNLTVEKALEMLKGSITNVKKRYVVIEGIPNSEPKIIQLERCFAYELYHQWSLHIESYNKGHNPDTPLELNGEISKHLDSKTTYPDIVLHGGQDDMTKQLMICEIKRMSGDYPKDDQIIDDLEKLHQYLNMKKNGEYIKFEHAVFIVANCNTEELKELINKTREKHPNDFSKILECRDKITCIAVNTEGERLNPESKLLSELI